MVNSKHFLGCVSSIRSHKLSRMSSERRPIAAIVRKFHDGTAEATDSILERALRIAPRDEKRAGELPALLHRFGNQNFTFEGMSFHQIREIFRVISPRPDELFC